MKKLALIAIGIPGSGKTTILSPLADKYGFRRISRDDIRQQLFGHPFYQEQRELVLKEAERQVRDAFSANLSVIKDSTFATPDKRRQAIESVRAAGAERVIGIIFTTPLEVAKVRNAAREHSVSEEVIEMMHADLEKNPPTLEEGFDALFLDTELATLVEKELG